MKKLKRILKIFSISILSVFLLLIGVLFIYTRGSYKALDDMNQAIDDLNLNEITVVNDFDQISYFVDNPLKNIIIIPGGKVKPESYQYLAVSLALKGYDVTIAKTLFNLAILTPNYATRFIKSGIENVVIGHSLGGTVGSIISSGDVRVTDMVFLASYPIQSVVDKRVLLLTAANDLVLDMGSLVKSSSLLPDDAVSFDIEGGNHAGFGWYGIQKDDGQATISIKEQQDIIINQIIEFII